MAKIDLTVYPDRLERTIQRVRERNIIIPTFAQMRNPSLVPDKIKEQLKTVGLWDLDPRNLFRITWHNEPKASGGLFGGLNYIEFPESLTGTPARIVALVGKWFPTGAHKLAQPLAVWCPAWSPVNLTPPSKKLSGPPLATTAVAAPMTPPCWPANPSPSSLRK